MKNIKLTKNEVKTKNIILLITSLFVLLVGCSFFLSDIIKFVKGTEIFYIVMLLYFGAEFTNYLLTRKITGMHSLYISMVCLIASVSGLLYGEAPINLVLTYTMIGWSFAMIVIKLIKIEELRNKTNYSLFINMFTLSLFILLGFLTITNIYMEITNVCLMLGFFFTVNGILNMVETFGNIKFCK